MPHNRLQSVRALLHKHHCTHILVTDTIDITYISGFAASYAVLLISADSSVLFTDFRYKAAAENFVAQNPQWRFVMIKERNFSFCVPELRGQAMIGFQSDILTVNDLATMKKNITRARFVPIAQEISDISIVKTDAEIAAIKKAASIADKALAQFKPLLKPGMTEREAAAELDRTCSLLGSEKPSFDTIMLFGKNSALPHGVPGKTRLKNGDFVLIDFGCTVQGFCSDMTRTYVFGKPSLRQKELFSIVLDAQGAARRAARSGMTTKALDAVARAIITSAGYGDQFGHGLGHGVGRRIHEQPRVAPTSKEKLLANSVVTIEPGIYMPDVGGVRIEDTVVLSSQGARILTTTPRDDLLW